MCLQDSFSQDSRKVEDYTDAPSSPSRPRTRKPSITGNEVLARERVAKSTALEWVDHVLEKMWPKVNAAVQKAVKEEFELKVRSKLPSALKSMEIERFSFGDEHLKVRHVEVWDAPCLTSELDRRGVEIHIRIAMDSELDITLRIGLLSAGISKLSLVGTLVIRLDPLLKDIPIVGGIVVYFLDPPTIDLTFSGIAQIADSSLVAHRVRSTIESLVAGSIVLPNTVCHSLAKNEAEVDTAMMRDPKPQGVLRVTALKAEGLVGHDWHLFGRATSDPYLRLMLGVDCWQSSVVYKTCDPVWKTENSHDFLVYDMVQKLRIDVHDWGPSWTFDAGDIIGRAKPAMVMELLEHSNKPLVLYAATTDFDSDTDQGRECGKLYLDFQWLHITPSQLQPENDGCIVKVKIDEIFIPSSMNIQGACVVVKLGAEEKSTPVVKPVVLGDHAKGPAKQQAIAGHDELEVEHVICLTLDKANADTALKSGSLELSVVDNRRNSLGSHIFPLKTIARAPKHVLTWDRASPVELKGADGAPPVLAEVQLGLSGVIEMEHKEAAHTMRRRLKTMPKTMLFDFHSEKTQHPNGSADSPDASHEVCRTISIFTAMPESLDWMNKAFARLWPKIAFHVKEKFEDPYGVFNRKLQAKVPMLFKSLRFTKFELGSAPPVFGPIKVSQAPVRSGQAAMRGIELSLGIQLDSDADIQLTALHVSFGVQKIRIKGELVIRLEPLLDEVPVVGGVVVCFLDPPQVHMDFVKLARVVDNSPLAGRIRRLIDHSIAGALVMPNVCGVRLGKEGQCGGVDSALLRSPKPLGVLRVTAIRAEGLPAGLPVQTVAMLSDASTNPYLKIQLADDEWSSSTVSRTCDPVWPQGESYDFLFFDWRQKLLIEVLEGRLLGTSDKIARAEPLPILHALVDLDMQGGLPLYGHDETAADGYVEDETKVSGRLYLKCEWHLLKLGSRGSDEKCVVKVKADEVWVPHRFGEEGAIFQARIGNVERSTPLVKYNPPPPAPHESEESAADRHDKPKMIELEIEFILHLLVQAERLESETLELELVTKAGKAIGRTSVPMCHIMGAPDLSKVWGDQGQPRLRMSGPDGTQSEAMVSISVRGLERASRALLANPEGYSPSE